MGSGAVRVRFTQNLQRHVECPPGEHPGSTVAEVLAGYFADHPDVRPYVLDDQGAVRPHVTVFVADRTLTDRARQSDAVAPGQEIYVMQALSGGA